MVGTTVAVNGGRWASMTYWHRVISLAAGRAPTATWSRHWIARACEGLRVYERQAVVLCWTEDNRTLGFVGAQCLGCAFLRHAGARKQTMVAARTAGMHGGKFLSIEHKGLVNNMPGPGPIPQSLLDKLLTLAARHLHLHLYTRGSGEFGGVADSTADRGRYFDWVFARSTTRAQLDPARYTLRGVLSLASNGISHSLPIFGRPRLRLGGCRCPNNLHAATLQPPRPRDHVPIE